MIFVLIKMYHLEIYALVCTWVYLDNCWIYLHIFHNFQDCISFMRVSREMVIMAFPLWSHYSCDSMKRWRNPPQWNPQRCLATFSQSLSKNWDPCFSTSIAVAAVKSLEGCCTWKCLVMHINFWILFSYLKWNFMTEPYFYSWTCFMNFMYIFHLHRLFFARSLFSSLEQKDQSSVLLSTAMRSIVSSFLCCLGHEVAYAEAHTLLELLHIRNLTAKGNEILEVLLYHFNKGYHRIKTRYYFKKAQRYSF